MKKNNVLYLFIVSITLTISSILVIPKGLFNPYYLEKKLFKKKEKLKMSYFSDLDSDGTLEEIDLIISKKPGNSIVFKQNNKTVSIHNFTEGEVLVSNNLEISPPDKNNKKAIFFISATDSLLYLNILSFNMQNLDNPLINKVIIGPTPLYNGTPDVTNNKIDFFENNAVFDVQSGYSILPRNIYIYDVLSQSLKQTPRTSIGCRDFEIFNSNSKYYILLTHITAYGNTSPATEEKVNRNSSHPDTIELQRNNRVFFKYGDFSSYILLYNQDLKFQFEPIEYLGWTNKTISRSVIQNENRYIISMTQNVMDTINKTYITLCNMNGEIVKNINLKQFHSEFYSDQNNDYLIVKNEESNEYHTYTKELTFKSKIRNITSVIGYIDINNDGIKELLTFDDNKIVVFSNDLKTKTKTVLMDANYDMDLYNFHTYTHNNRSFIYFPIRDSYYILEYKVNNYFYAKYPSYVIIFIIWYVILYSFIKQNLKKLNTDNIRLEELVRLRTNELTKSNKHLKELTSFKDNMTSTIVHDLKNPLNIIINKTSDKQILNSARKMLNLVLNILDTTKYEKAGLILNKESFNLSDILHEITSHLELNCEEKNLSIKTLGTNHNIYADKVLIIRVIENLLINAIKFSNQNTDIKISATPVMDGKIKITIFNYGETISEENIKIIFDKFVHFKSNEIKSTGIGLYFCKMVIEAHDSAISVENFSHKGVSFSFLIDTADTKQHDSIPQIKNKLNLSMEDVEVLETFIPLLKNIDLYNASRIFEVVNQIPDENEAIVVWKKKIKTAVFTGNEELFYTLLNDNLN